MVNSGVVAAIIIHYWIEKCMVKQWNWCCFHP